MAGNAGRLERIDLKARLGMFDPDGSLVEDCREIWQLIEPLKEEIARQFWVEYARSPNLPYKLDEKKIDDLTQRIIAYVEARYANIADDKWVEMAG
jgi:methyl-accepting chemotaxis protein